MTLRQSLKSLARYYRRVLIQMRKDVWTFGVQQILIAVPVALCILLLQIRWGLTPRDLTFYNVLAVALPYLVVLILAVLFYGIRALWILDTDLQSEIEELKIKLAAEVPTEEKIERLRDVIRRGYQLLSKCQDETSVLSLPELMEWMGRGMGSIEAYVGKGESVAFGHCLKRLPPNCTVSDSEHRTACSFVFPRLELLEKHVERLRTVATENKSSKPTQSI